jgi:hypothetical protein
MKQVMSCHVQHDTGDQERSQKGTGLGILTLWGRFPSTLASGFCFLNQTTGQANGLWGFFNDLWEMEIDRKQRSQRGWVSYTSLGRLELFMG